MRPVTLATRLLPLAVAAALVACSGDSAQSLVASAKEHLARNDVAAAQIQLKSALQKDPESAEARYLLGKLLLDAGNAEAAAVELHKAVRLKYAENVATPDLARALVAAGEPQRLVEQFGQTTLSDAMAEADFKSSLASAYGVLGKRHQAEEALAAALKAVPDYGPAIRFHARLMADTGDLDGALAELDRIIARSPQDHEAWQLKAELLRFGKQDFDEALKTYRQVIAIRSNFAPAHAGAISILLGQRDKDGAKVQFEQLKAALPNHPQTRYFEGNLAVLDGELDKAQDIVNQLLRLTPNNPRVLLLAGTVAFERREYLQADAHLTRAVQAAPNQDTARRLLALTHLRQGQPTKALSVLQPMLDRAEPSATAFALAGQAHLQAGDAKAADAAFAKAAQLNPQDTRSRAALAVNRFLRGDAAAVADLQQLASRDEGIAADLPLISALVRNKDYPGALRAIDALEKKQPGDPMTWNLRGSVQMRQGDKAAARKSFEKALEIVPGFFPAAASLARMALEANDPKAAQAQFDKLLAADPRNAQALMASAALKLRGGAPREEVAALFANAVQQSPQAAAPRLALINFHLAGAEAKAALEAAQKAAAALPNSPDVLEALGRAQAAAGDVNQAIASFGKLAKLQPASAQPLVQLAEAHVAAKEFDAARQHLEKALTLEGDHLRAQRLLADLHVMGQRFDDALRVAREVQRQRPKEDVGFLIEGSAQYARKDWAAAEAAFRKGLQAEPKSADMATRLHATLVAAGRKADADKLSAGWLREHPKDVAFHFYLGDLALGQGDAAAAEGHYRDVLRLQPEHALAMNNVAWLMTAAKKTGALELAQQADRLLPNRPAIMDTLALVLANEGQPAKAVEVLRRAVSLDADNSGLRFNLAKTLIQAGDKGAARSELEALAKLGDKFPRQAEVGELLKTL